MRQWNIDKAQLSWANLDMKEGIAKGTAIKESKNSRTWNTKTTGTGRLIRFKDPDKSGKLTITVDRESKTHQRLTTLALADELAENIVFPGVLHDESLDETTVYVNMFIESIPDESLGTEASTIDWVFIYERKIPKPGSGDANVVGT